MADETYSWLKLGRVEINFVESLMLGLAKLRELHSQTMPAVSNKLGNIHDEVRVELKKVSATSHQVLFKTSTVFPLDLFPDTVTIDREKLTIVQRLFFLTARLISIPVRDILSVELSVGPFFGSINVTSRYFSIQTPHMVRFLWRRQAIKLQRLLQGYIIANERDIDCRVIPLTELEGFLMDIGRGDTK